VNDTTTPRKRKGLESSVRRSLELFLLALSLIVGLGVIGGCGGVMGAMSDNGGAIIFAGALAAGALLVGVVYLAVSMSRDVRILKQKLLEREERSAGTTDPETKA
jgi:amino acid transporter